ncbi:hypothetical protein B0T14DRAFT_520607, partial [Immersiella caudata]
MPSSPTGLATGGLPRTQALPPRESKPSPPAGVTSNPTTTPVQVGGQQPRAQPLGQRAALGRLTPLNFPARPRGGRTHRRVFQPSRVNSAFLGWGASQVQVARKDL